jgi:hypothetical protein
MSIWEIIKNIFSLLPAVLAFMDKGYQWLPVNPAVREEWTVPSIILAIVTGLGGYYRVKSTRNPSYGWIGLVFALISISAIIFFGGGTTFNLTPGQVSAAVRFAYVVFFTSLGLTCGGFAGLAP